MISLLQKSAALGCLFSIMLLAPAVCPSLGQAMENPAPEQALNGAAGHKALSGRELYAARMEEKMAYMLKMRRELAEAGFYGVSEYRGVMPRREQLEYLWVTRNSPEGWQAFMSIATNADIPLEARDDYADSLAGVLDGLLQSEYLRHFEYESGTGDDFAELCSYEAELESRAAFILELIILFEGELSRYAVRDFSLNKEHVDYLWKKKPSRQQLANLVETLGDKNTYFLTVEDIASMLAGEDAYAQRKKIADFAETAGHFAFETGYIALTKMLLPASVIEEFEKPGALPYVAAAGISASAPAAEMSGVDNKNQPANGVKARRLDISYTQGKAPVALEAGEKLYALYMQLPEGMSQGSWSPSRHEDIMAENPDRTLLSGSPLDAAAGSSARVRTFSTGDAFFWRQVLDPQPLGTSDFIGGLLVVSSSPYDEVVEHLGWLSMALVDEDLPEAYADMPELVDIYSRPLLNYRTVSGVNLAWLTLLGNAETAGNIMGPLNRLYVYWPQEDSKQPWVELSRRGQPGPARKLGRDPLLAFDAETRQAVLAPLRNVEFRANMYAQVEAVLSSLSDEGFVELDAESRRELVDKVIDMAVECDIAYRNAVIGISMGVARAGATEANYRAVSAIFSDKSKKVWERFDEFEEWVQQNVPE